MPLKNHRRSKAKKHRSVFNIISLPRAASSAPESARFPLILGWIPCNWSLRWPALGQDWHEIIIVELPGSWVLSSTNHCTQNCSPVPSPVCELPSGLQLEPKSDPCCRQRSPWLLSSCSLDWATCHVQSHTLWRWCGRTWTGTLADRVLRKKKKMVDVFSGKTKNHRLSKSKRLEVNGGSAAVFCCHMLTRCSHDCFGSNDKEISQGDWLTEILIGVCDGDAKLPCMEAFS